MKSTLATRIADEYARLAPALPDRIVERAQREHAVQALLAQGLPGSRDENWRYANLRALERVQFAPVTEQAGSKESSAIPLSALPAPIEGYVRHTYVDGAFAPALSSGVPQSPVNGHLARSVRGDQRFALLNDAFATDAASIHISESHAPQRAVELVFVACAEGTRAASYPRLEIEVGAGCHLKLIERHISIGSDENFVSSAVRLALARDATVTHYRIQQLGARATWIDTLEATVEAGGNYQQHLAQVGALAARSTYQVRLAGERAAACLYALTSAEQRQTLDAYALSEHAAPRTESNQIFRGIAAGRARVGFNGEVRVCSGAAGADSRQSLRGLLAGPDAEIDVRPQLQINTDDVRCTHGATAGKLDEAMLFYLLSRGLDAAAAQRLLKWAFLADVAARIEVPELRRSLERSLAGRMQIAAEMQELL
jgi:Fe-S cluster assembly protein SufD